MARREKILRDGVFPLRQQLGSFNADQLDGNAARLGMFVLVDHGVAVGEPHQRRKNPRHGEDALTGIVRQVSEHLKLRDQPGMRLGVKPAEWFAPFGVLVLLLKPPDVLREPVDQVLLIRQRDLLPSRAGRKRRFGGWSNGHDMPPPSRLSRAPCSHGGASASVNWFTSPRADRREPLPPIRCRTGRGKAPPEK